MWERIHLSVAVPVKFRLKLPTKGKKKAINMTNSYLMDSVAFRAHIFTAHYIEEYVSHRPICSVCCLLAREWIEKPTSSQKTEADRAKSALKNLGFNRRAEASPQRLAHFRCRKCNVNFCDWRCYNMYHKIDTWMKRHAASEVVLYIKRI